MELADGTRDVVDPEVRAYVSSLVTALGGSGADEDGRYVLGDDALACLRDLKRWLKLYDEKANRLDVARCLAESNLVNGDLLQILAAWPENAIDDKFKSRIALACLELLVPLTWPLDKNREMTVNHARHLPYLQLAQVGYKRSIVNFDGARILHTAVRVALPSMAVDLKERSSRDEGVIKLVLYFLRNITMIEPPPGVAYDGDEVEISRSALIDAFEWQDIFHLLLTLCSSMGEEFNTQDVVVMEILFHLIKGVDISKLFMNEAQLDKHKVDELVGLRNKEAGLLRGYQRTAPTRHNRFGTMIWVKRDDEKMSSVSGQDALLNGARTLEKMDKVKKFKPPNRAPKGETGPMNFDLPVPLNPRAAKSLRNFVEEFLDSGFNPLFQHIRKAIDREAERLLDYHHRQFFYLISWFLEAERVRRASKKSSNNKSSTVEDADSFGIIASVMNQEMFITLNRAMQKNYEDKAWHDLNAAMKCFTQILLTVQEMSESPLEEDQEIAENILSRIFYEETTHDRVAYIVRYYRDQGFGYLDACTELAHVYLRILENHSKQNTELQVRSRRRTRRKKKAEQRASDPFIEDENDDVDESDGDDEAHAERVSSERKFDFKRFASRFLAQGCIDTFVKFCSYYNDLKPEQLKRAHRFFYRVAFKMEMSVMLFRVDIIALLHKMIKGPEGLDPASPVFKEWDELVKQVLKKCIKKIQQRPELIVEMLFSKTNSTAFYLEYGYEKQTISTAKPRSAAELKVAESCPVSPLQAVVSALLDRNEGDHVKWVKNQLSAVQKERKKWEDEFNPIYDTPEQEAAALAAKALLPEPAGPPPQAPDILLKPDNDERRVALFKNGYLRLLLKLVEADCITDDDDPNTSWVMPGWKISQSIEESLEEIKKVEWEPPVFEDGRKAEDFIKRKSALAPRNKAAYDDESDNGIVADDDLEALFPLGGPTTSKSDALDALKKNRRRRRRRGSSASGSDSEGGGLTEEQLDARRAARREKELEKRRKIKSALYVHDSDDESDEERDRLFFEQEEKLRKRANVEGLKALLEGKGAGGVNGEDEILRSNGVLGEGKRKRRANIDAESGSDDDESDDAALTSIQRRRAKRRPGSSSSIVRSASASVSLSEDEDQTENTPPSSSSSPPSRTEKRTKRARLSNRVNDNSAAAIASVSSSRLATPDIDDDEDVHMDVDGGAEVGVGKAAPGMGASGVAAEDEDEDEDVAPIARPARNRVRGGFVIESSDEE